MCHVSYIGNSCFVFTNGISMFADHLGQPLRFNRTIAGLRATAGRALVVAAVIVPLFVAD